MREEAEEPATEGPQTTSIYQPLDVSKMEIRLLHIEDELDTEGRVQCRLQVVSLLDASPSEDADERSALDQGAGQATEAMETSHAKPFYEALSWTWGDASIKGHVILNKQLFEVPRTAELVLRRFCFEQGHRTVWLDAVCIYQDDLKERAHQVSIMRHVYRTASQVLVWLGEDDGNAEDAFASVDVLVAHCRSFCEHRGSPASVLADIYAEGEVRALSDPDGWDKTARQLNFNAINNLYSVAWFSRVWVVQEVALATSTRAYQGAHHRSWDDIGLAAHWLQNHMTLWIESSNSAPELCLAASHMWQLSHNRATTDMTHLLQLSQELKAADPRDKVYGILGLLHDESHYSKAPLHIYPDYAEDLCSVYAKATKVAILSIRNDANTLGILSYAQVLIPAWEDAGQDRHWPSWVPRYHWVYDTNRGAPYPVLFHGEFADVLRFQPRRPYAELPGVFTINGINIDKVSECMRLGAGVEIVDRVRHFHKALCPPHSLRTLAMTLICGTVWRRSDADKDSDLVSKLEMFMNSAKNTWPGEVQDYARQVGWNMRHRELLTTEFGRLGSGVPGTRPGDHVCVLGGGEVPFILRPRDDHFILVGQVYVHGVMRVGELHRPLSCFRW